MADWPNDLDESLAMMVRQHKFDFDAVSKAITAYSQFCRPSDAEPLPAHLQGGIDANAVRQRWVVLDKQRKALKKKESAASPVRKPKVGEEFVKVSSPAKKRVLVDSESNFSESLKTEAGCGAETNARSVSDTKPTTVASVGVTTETIVSTDPRSARKEFFEGDRSDDDDKDEEDNKPSNFSIFKHDLKTEIEGIYDVVKSNLPSMGDANSSSSDEEEEILSPDRMRAKIVKKNISTHNKRFFNGISTSSALHRENNVEGLKEMELEQERLRLTDQKKESEGWVEVSGEMSSVASVASVGSASEQPVQTPATVAAAPHVSVATTAVQQQTFQPSKPKKSHRDLDTVHLEDIQVDTMGDDVQSDGVVKMDVNMDLDDLLNSLSQREDALMTESDRAKPLPAELQDSPPVSPGKAAQYAPKDDDENDEEYLARTNARATEGMAVGAGMLTNALNTMMVELAKPRGAPGSNGTGMSAMLAEVAATSARDTEWDHLKPAEEDTGPIVIGGPNIDGYGKGNAVPTVKVDLSGGMPGGPVGNRIPTEKIDLSSAMPAAPVVTKEHKPRRRMKFDFESSSSEEDESPEEKARRRAAKEAKASAEAKKKEEKIAQEKAEREERKRKKEERLEKERIDREKRQREWQKVEAARKAREEREEEERRLVSQGVSREKAKSMAANLGSMSMTLTEAIAVREETKKKEAEKKAVAAAEAATAAKASTPAKAAEPEAPVEPPTGMDLFDESLSVTAALPALPADVLKSIAENPKDAKFRVCTVVMKSLSPAADADFIQWLKVADPNIRVVGLLKTHLIGPFTCPTIPSKTTTNATACYAICMEWVGDAKLTVPLSGRLRYVIGASTIGNFISASGLSGIKNMDKSTPLTAFVSVCDNVKVPLGLTATETNTVPSTHFFTSNLSMKTLSAETSDSSSGYSVSILRPEALSTEGALADILKRVDSENLDLVGLRTVYPSAESVKELQRFSTYVPPQDEMCMAMLVRGWQAVQRWNRAVGPDDPVIARCTDSTSLRAMHGISRSENLLTCSVNPARARQEMSYWFGGRWNKKATNKELASTVAIHSVCVGGLERVALCVGGNFPRNKYGEVIDVAMKKGFKCEGLKHVELESQDVEDLELPSAFGQGPVLMVLLQKENAIHHMSCLTHLFERLADGAAGLIHCATNVNDSMFHFVRARALPNRAGVHTLLDVSGDIQEQSDDSEQVVVFTILPDVTAGSDIGEILNSILAPGPSEANTEPCDRNGRTRGMPIGFELLGMKYISKLDELCARELSPFETSHSSFAESVGVLMAGPVIVCALRRVGGLKRMEKIAGPVGALDDGFNAFGDCDALRNVYGVDDVQSGVVYSRNARTAYRQLCHLFSRNEISEDIQMRPLAKFMMKTEIKSLKALFPVPQAVETVCIVKPDVISRGHLGRILKHLINEKFEVVGMELTNLSKETATSILAADGIKEGHPKMQAGMDFLTNETDGAVCILALRKIQAIKKLTELMGPADAAHAKKLDEFFLRSTFGKDLVHNAMYASLSMDNAEDDIRRFFANGLAGSHARDPAVGWKPSQSRRIVDRQVSLMETVCVVLTNRIVRDGFLGEILDKVLREGFKCVGAKMVHLPANTAADYLHIHFDGAEVSPNVSRDTADDLKAGPIVALAFERNNAISSLSTLLSQRQGSASCRSASLADQFGSSILAASNVRKAHEELLFFFEALHGGVDKIESSEQ